jgi:tetratricopeptide (TPR) repeat protein
MRSYRLVSIAGVLLLAVASTGCNRLKARDHLNKGVNAFRAAQFQEAIDHFQQAAALDPKLLNARLYLAMSYFQQYAPGGESPDNKKIGQQAVDAFKNVLDIDPNNSTALAYTGLLYYNMKDFDNAKQFQQRRQNLDPNNPEPYYWIGVIDYLHCVKNQSAARNTDPKLATPDRNGELPPLPEKLRAPLAQQNGAAIKEGMDALNKAIELKPNYDEAMAYLNLLYRQKADIESDSGARASDIKSANDWLAKALEARKQAATQPAAATSTTSTP